MKITKDYGLLDEGYRYRINGDLISETSIKIELDKPLFVSGFIKS